MFILFKISIFATILGGSTPCVKIQCNSEFNTLLWMQCNVHVNPEQQQCNVQCNIVDFCIATYTWPEFQIIRHCLTSLYSRSCPALLCPPVPTAYDMCAIRETCGALCACCCVHCHLCILCMHSVCATVFSVCAVPPPANCPTCAPQLCSSTILCTFYASTISWKILRLKVQCDLWAPQPLGLNWKKIEKHCQLSEMYWYTMVQWLFSTWWS